MPLKALVLSGAAVAAWGAGALFDKLALDRLPVKAVFFGRIYILVVLFLAPMVLAWDGTREAVRASDKSAVAFMFASVAFTMAGMWAYFQALRADEASRVVPLCAAYPLVAAVLAAVVLKEPFTAAKVGGTLLIMAGTVLLAR